MRPISLKMSAFGPYAEETEIRMDLLGDQGLYLITGDTGAGKTTIFDAICYALYGEPSGPTRDPSMFRSKYALPDTPTFVDLTFLHNGKEYRIERNPEYVRPAKRGGGETKQNASVTFHLPDGSVITGKAEALKAVENLIGLTRNQFSQISMLAQGDFLKLLLSSTGDRQQIFRKLFQTDLYERLQKRIEEDRKEVERDCQDAVKSVRQYIGEIACEKGDLFEADVERAGKGEMAITDVIGLIERINQSDLHFAEKEEEQAELLRGQIKELHEKIGLLEAAETSAQTLERTKKNLSDSEQKKAPMKERLDLAQEELKRKDELNRQVGELEKETPQYEKILSIAREEKQKESELRRKDAELKDASSKREKAEKELGELEAELETLQKAGEESEKLKAAGEQSEEQLRKLDALSSEMKAYTASARALKTEQDHFGRYREEYIRKQGEYETIYLAYLNGQAGILAETLREGTPCPVCGSTNHPSPAKKTEEVPTREALMSAKATAEQARKQMEQASTASEKKRAEKETRESTLLKNAGELLGVTSVEEIPAAWNEACSRENKHLREIGERIEIEEKRRRRKAELEKLIPTRRGESEDLKKLENELKTNIAALQTYTEGLKNRREELASSLKYPGIEEHRQRIRELREQAESIQKRYDSVLEENKSLDAEIEKLRGSIEALNKAIAGHNVEELPRKRALSSSLTDKQNNLTAQLQERKRRIRNNEEIRKKIQSGSEKIDLIEKKLRWISNLADTVGGKMTGKNKIMLETYIQTTYFDRIIRRANLRLMQMTSGQYELKRADEAGSLKSQSGLDLNVIDHHNGSERSVKTLSGGESFMASLSLALGLSDEIQASAGGIRVDTVFVDEGFGSLDPEALEQAYRALISLTEGKQLVGIISHVEELKEKIDRQIVVTKDKDGGSHVKVQV